MNSIFTLDDDTDGIKRVNLDDLYERKKKHDLHTLSIYKKILGRIHNRINTISRQQIDEQYCWFLIPEMMIGVPNYDNSACIEYCISELTLNGFNIRYTHPNLLLISWKHWIPSYVRNEIKKKTGVNVDGYGNKIQNDSKAENPDSMFQRSKQVSSVGNKEFNDISSYKPSGNMIYNKDLLKNIENKSKK